MSRFALTSALGWALALALALGACELQDDVLEVQATTGEDATDASSSVVQDCSEPPCVLSCAGVPACEQSCIGECMTDCRDTNTCDITCSGPAPRCVSSCSSTDECRLSCPQGNCVLQCSDVSSCHIEDCTENCVVTCGGAEDCSVSCSLGAGCVET